MKKFLTAAMLSLVFVLSVSAFAACGGNTTTTDSYSLYAPDGAPVLALADMWGEDFTYDNGSTADMTYTVTGEANVNALMLSGDADFIVAPINVGAQIHAGYKAGNAQYDYKLVNVTSWGVVYFTTNSDAYKAREEFEDTTDGAKEFLMQFDGTAISTIGLAAIPGKSVEYLFGEAGADVQLNGADATVIQQSYVKGDPMTAIFAQPAITGVQSQGSNVTVLASVSEVYKELTGKDFPMAGLFVRADILENAPDLVDVIDERVSVSVEKFNTEIDTVADKAAGIEGFSLKAPVIKKAYDKLNVAYKDADASMSDVKTLLDNIGAACDDELFV